MTNTHHHRTDGLFTPKAHLGAYTLEFIRCLWAPVTVAAIKQQHQLLQLARRFSADRLEAACRRALFYKHGRQIQAVSMILYRNLDRLPLDPATDITANLLLSIFE